MHWVIQNNIYSEEGWERLVSALERLGVSYSVHKCVPFAGTLEPEPAPPPGNVVVMGSYTLAREAQRRGWVPGVFLNGNFDFRVQEARWGRRMFNWGALVCKFSEVPEQREPFFLRPVEDSKSFTGEVMDWPSFREWRDRVLSLEQYSAQIQPSTPVMVCQKRRIAREFRTWVVDGRVVTASLYKTGTWKHYQEVVRAAPHGHGDDGARVIDFAEDCAALWSPDRAYVLDVFEDEGGGLHVGEVNNLNSAGFYAADMQKLVHAVDSMEFPVSL